ncbi:hypothetical protein D915_002583 [Fasciola hepatica]|uniref:Uncharacterized protein n=1 Tax=Fasciola hepatica TaxID=6192 RepID=A0A4E0RLB4_FASHE|nr:hypothetical protein D915_002583 [Fasciola hepatica]
MLSIVLILVAWCLKSRRRRAQRELRKREQQSWLLAKQGTAGLREAFDVPSIHGSTGSGLCMPPGMDALAGSLGRLTPYTLRVSKETLGPQHGSYYNMAHQERRDNRSISTGNLPGMGSVTGYEIHKNSFRSGLSTLELQNQTCGSRTYATVQRGKKYRSRTFLHTETARDCPKPRTFCQPPEEQQWADESGDRRTSGIHLSDSVQSDSEFDLNSQLERYNSYSNDLIRASHSGPGPMTGFDDNRSPLKRRRKQHRLVRNRESENERTSLTTFGVPNINSEPNDIVEPYVPQRSQSHLRRISQTPLQSWLRTEETGLISQDWEI